MGTIIYKYGSIRDNFWHILAGCEPRAIETDDKILPARSDGEGCPV